MLKGQEYVNTLSYSWLFIRPSLSSKSCFSFSLFTTLVSKKSIYVEALIKGKSILRNLEFSI